jgi:hypothetical protein
VPRNIETGTIGRRWQKRGGLQEAASFTRAREGRRVELGRGEAMAALWGLRQTIGRVVLVSEHFRGQRPVDLPTGTPIAPLAPPRPKRLVVESPWSQFLSKCRRF